MYELLCDPNYQGQQGFILTDQALSEWLRLLISTCFWNLSDLLPLWKNNMKRKHKRTHARQDKTRQTIFWDSSKVVFLWSLCYIILFHEFLFCASLASISACSKIAILYGQLRRFLGHWVCMKRRHQSHTTKNTFWSVPSSSYRLQCLIICFCSMCPLRQGIQDLQMGAVMKGGHKEEQNMACWCPNDAAQCKAVSPSAQSKRGSALANSKARQTC